MAASLTLDRAAMKDPTTAHCRIYIGNLSDKATQDAVYEHFVKYGQILGVALNRGFGFIQFETEASSQDAITGEHRQQFLGRSLVVKTAMTNTDKSNVNAQTKPVNEAVETQQATTVTDSQSLADGGEEYGGWEEEEAREEQGGPRPAWGSGGRGWRGGVRGRPRGGERGGGYRDRSPLSNRGQDWEERGYNHYPAKEPILYRPPAPERNDCEIIVVSKLLTEYAEYIESRLKRVGLTVDLLFPMEDVPIGKVLGNIATRGCLYAILVMPVNQEHNSLTLNILHGLPQEHRNMPVDDALQLIARNYAELARGGGSAGREAVYALLGQLADGKSLTVLQYDKVIQYLQERREQQVKVELGSPEQDKTQTELQQRIMSILNKKPPAPSPPPAAPITPHTVPPSDPAAPRLLSDPSVQKALDSLFQKFI